MKVIIPIILSLSIFAFIPRNSTTKLFLYETFETNIIINDISGNKFLEYINVEFRNGGRKFNIKAFYYGKNIWKIRFMPDKPGSWEYNWIYNGKHDSGRFHVNKTKKPRSHGHVHRKGKHLICDDGTTHYWYGGKWIEAHSYGPKTKFGVENIKYVDDTVLISYFDTLYRYKHNGLLLKVGLYPLEDDGITWDTLWLNRADRLIKEMGKRGIYCQVNIWETWGRGKDSVFTENMLGDKQVLNAWKDGELIKKENYIKYIVSRFSGFYNVYWELGNEVEHRPNSGDDFARQANKYYVPWIRKYDSYNLPIGLSEGTWRKTDVDIGFCHNPWDFPKATDTVPIILNEQVFWAVADGEKPGPPLWDDSTIRDSDNRFIYRRAFWKIFTLGGNGASECTWLDINKSLNRAVINVMHDQLRLRNFMEALPVNFKDLKPELSVVRDCCIHNQTLSYNSECFVTYLYKNAGNSNFNTTLNLQLLQGKYKIQWFQPSTGEYSEIITTEAAGLHNIKIPSFKNDIVLTIMKK